jgi:predicted DNA-binding transcriptional regulator YafY
MRGDQLARQWQLIQRLAKSHAGVGLDDLAEDLGCVRRTVYRDLDALMYAGFPVVSDRRDGHVYYRFLDTFRLGDVPFTPDEILALAFSEDLLRTLEGTVFHDSIRSALAKIRAGLGPELSIYLERLAESFRVLPGPHKRYAEFRETIRILNDSVVTCTSVEIRYRTGSSGAVRTRKLDPYRVWYRSGGLYVIGHDHRSSEIRTFAIDRIERIAPMGDDERFSVAEGFDFDEHTAAAFGVASEPATSLCIRFAARVRTYIEEREWHPSQRLEPLPGGDLELRMEVGSTAELRAWIQSFGSDAEVLAPVSLRDEVGAEMEAAAAKYRPEPPPLSLPSKRAARSGPPTP